MRSAEDEQPEEVTREEVDAAQRQLSAYRELIEEVPQIYEQKFRERLEPIHARNQQLLEEGRLLEDQLAELPPSERGVPAPGALPPARELAGALPLLRRPGLRWLGLASLAAALLLGYGVTHSLRQPRTVQSPANRQPSLRPAPAASEPPAGAGPFSKPSSPAPGELLVKTRGLSWMEVRTLSDTTLFFGNLQGERSFPLGRGLRISAGRPDLVTVQRHGEPARTLGGIREIGWHSFAPTPPAEEGGSKGRQPIRRP